MENWQPIKLFPSYLVSDHGRVLNEETGHYLALLKTQRGIVYVGLNKCGTQYKRSVTVLVAEAFLPQAPHPAFDTPINLDGVRDHNHAFNLLWRPRWFAVKYHQQFSNDVRGFTTPIEDIETGEQFKTSWDAATQYGLIDLHIKVAVMNQQRVWPTRQLYRLL
jgi:NUMOD4 motif-containing protein